MSGVADKSQMVSLSSHPHDVVRALAQYRHPDQYRSIFELAVTIIPFIALWAAAWWALSISYWLTLAISLLASAFLVRIFLIQHDCGHGAFFRSRVVNDRIGRILSVLTLTPYDFWRWDHSAHHAASGNLDKRGNGDIDTMTVKEYSSSNWYRRLQYRLYRHPIVLFGIGPAYQFLLRYRIPSRINTENKRFWFSVMATNLTIALVVGTMIYFLGAGPFFLVQLPITIIASSIGVWLFYVQHQFEDTYWEGNGKWNIQSAAFIGSSHYDLPPVLRWLTANIGVHHVHHLASRIPYYRLQDVLKDHPELANIRRLTLWESFKCARYRLWDEGQRKMVSFAEARALQAG